MLRYWFSVLVRANQATFQWIFGDLARAVVQVIVFFIAVLLLRQTERIEQLEDELTWAVALLAAAGIIYIPTLLFHFFRVPFLRDKEKNSEIDRLKKIAGELRPTSFDVWIEEIPEGDADRRTHGGENLVRIGITNLEHKLLTVRVVLEDLQPSCGVSPAAALPVMGRPVSEVNVFSIASSETAYVLLVKRGELGIRFSVGTSYIGTVGAAVHFARPSLGAIPIGKRCTGTIAVHGKDAVSRRLPFALEVSSEETVAIISGEKPEKAAHTDMEDSRI